MYNSKIKIFVLFLITLCYGAAVVGEGRIATSTNPAKTMVKELQLPNYDTALDSLDYSVPHEKIKWPWTDDQERQEKRIKALEKLIQTKAIYRLTEIVKRYPKQPLKVISWDWGYDETDGTFYAYGNKATDKLLFETLPFIPEVEICSFAHTSITDEGLKALFYLPLLKGIGLDTVEPDTHPLPITDKGIMIISKHPSLEGVSLRNVRITDESFRSLAQNAKNLKRLSYTGDGITSQGLECLKEADSLVTLALTNTNAEIPVITEEALGILAKLPNLQYLRLENYDLSTPPTERQLESLKKFDDGLIRLGFRDSKIHPNTLRAVCEITTLQSLSIFGFGGVGLEPTEEDPLSYEKLMYRLRNASLSMFGGTGSVVPDYYEELEKPYFEEFYVRTWTSSSGLHTHKAAFVDLVDSKVFLRTTYDGEPFSVAFDRLSTEDQEYVQDIVGPPR